MDESAARRAQAAINRRGHLVRFRRMSSTTPQTVEAQADVRAVVAGYDPVTLVRGVTQGRRRVTVSLADLEVAGFPLPLARIDRIYLGDDLDIPTTIETIDTDHRSYQRCAEITTTGW